MARLRRGWGPRSVMVTLTELPFFRLTTRTTVPSGMFQAAAVSLCRSNGFPLAIFLPWCCFPYQEATPTYLGLLPNTRLTAWAKVAALGAGAAATAEVHSRPATNAAANIQVIRSFVCMSVLAF